MRNSKKDLFNLLALKIWELKDESQHAEFLSMEAGNGEIKKLKIKEACISLT